MLNRISDWWNNLEEKQRKIFINVILGIVFVALIVVCVIWIISDNKKDNDTESMNNVAVTEELSENSEEMLIELPESNEVDETETEEDTKTSVAEAEEDPQNTGGGSMTSQEGASIDISQVVENVNGNETKELTLGIDVSKYQGTINWKKGRFWCGFCNDPCGIPHIKNRRNNCRQ